MKRFFFSIALLLSVNLAAQEVKFYGEAKQGGIIIGIGKNISGVWLDGKQLQVDKSALFIFGFDRDAKGKSKLKVKFKNKKVETYSYVIEAQKYEEQRLQLAQKYVTPPKKLTDRIRREARTMKAARAKIGTVKEAFFISGFNYPVDSINIKGVFGSRRILNNIPKNIHNGVDFSADEGDSVYSISDGIVRLAGENFFFNGNFILIDHGQGLSSVYLHLSKLLVKNGQKIQKGELIGLAGSTGRSTAPHLHLGVQWYKKRIDPMSLFSLQIPSGERD